MKKELYKKTWYIAQTKSHRLPPYSIGYFDKKDILSWTAIAYAFTEENANLIKLVLEQTTTTEDAEKWTNSPFNCNENIITADFENYEFYED